MKDTFTGLSLQQGDKITMEIEDFVLQIVPWVIELRKNYALLK